MKPTIYSVRHGQSVTNVCRELHKRVSDPEVWLTEKGHEQAQDAAEALVQHFKELPQSERPRKIRIMRSSYRRAKQTANHFMAALGSDDFNFSVKEEDARLRELEFGYAGALEEPLPYVDWHTNILRYQGHKYLARRFGGESPADLEPRVRLALDAIFRDFQENHIDTFIVVSHGLTSRVLTKVRYGYHNEWYQNEPNPDNCSIRWLGDQDHGFIFPNARGQWEFDWKGEAQEAGDEKFNPDGLFFSQKEIVQLIALQKTDPTIMSRINTYIEKNPSVIARDVFRQMAMIPYEVK